ncbi:MAG: tripartite tricarboxylate transporter TctB family protein [Thermodesulfobacteriota bacterium]
MKLDRVSGIFLFMLGAGVFLKSLSYPLGNFRRPGGGLFPLIASILLMGLSATLTLQAFLSKEGEKAAPAPFFPEKDAPKRIVLGFVALLAYRYLLPVIGFGPSTFAFIFILSKFLGKYGWKVSTFFSLVSAASSYYLFQVWLKIPMPIPALRF